MADMEADSLLFEVGAAYEGGHPQFVHGATGKLLLQQDLLEFKSREVSFTIPISDVVGCELQPQQFSLLRTMFAAEARSLQMETNMAHVTCNIGGLPYELRFHIHGALTIPGESKKARAFRDILYTRQQCFARPANEVEAPTHAAIPAEIRELARLHDDGILTDEEFGRKKAELLARL